MSTKDTIIINPVIYILQLEDNKYYVGSTGDFQKRLEQHKDGLGAKFTQKYKFKKVYRTITTQKSCRLADLLYNERQVTFECMKKFGIQNVRGAYYTKIELDKIPSRLVRNCNTNIARLDLPSDPGSNDSHL